MFKKSILSALALVALAGCSTFKPAEPPAQDPLLKAVQDSADKVVSQLDRYELKAPIIVASAQNNNELRQVCPQGRLVADVVSSRLTQKGLQVTEIRLGNQVRINAEGETVLSRELAQLAKSTKADVVLAATWSTFYSGGTLPTFYSPGTEPRGRTYLTLKAIRLSDGLVLGSHASALPVGWDCSK